MAKAAIFLANANDCGEGSRYDDEVSSFLGGNIYCIGGESNVVACRWWITRHGSTSTTSCHLICR